MYVNTPLELLYASPPSPEADASEPTLISVSAIPPLPPAIVIVFVEPVPDATTPEPTKLIVDAAVDNAEPSSCTVICPQTVPGSH